MTTNNNRKTRVAPGVTGRGTGMVLSLLAGLGASLGCPAISQAQELTEIVVTARKVEEKLKDVPLAITAFDADTIESAGITNLQDVANLTPGLSFFNAFGENLPVPVIRGIVPQDIFGQNATAIFVDNVYVSGREGLNFSQLDIERIEVLKGPQSAEYGRNAFSGAINYVTKAPSDVFEAKTEGEVGNRGKERIMGVLSGPILSDALTGRVSAMYEDWDGSYDNTLAGGNDIGGHQYRSLQGKLRWRPLDSLDINLGLYYSNDEIDNPATAGLPVNCEDQVEQTTENLEGSGPTVDGQATGPQIPRLQNWCGAVPDLAALPDALDPSQFPNRVAMPNSVTKDSMPLNPMATGEDRDLVRGSLNIAWDGAYGTLTFLTGYSDTKQKSVSDFERTAGVSIPLVYCNQFASPGVATCLSNTDFSYAPMGFINKENGTSTEEWSQEIRFRSPSDERLRYATGVYYYNVDQQDHPGELIATTRLPSEYTGFFYPNIGIGPVAYPTSLAIGSYIFGPSLTPDGTIDPLNRLVSREKTEAWSIFGSLDFDLTDAWQARAELRLSEESQHNFAYDYKRCAQPNPNNDISYDQLGYQINVFPFNSPPVADCLDDFQDLRVTAPCVAIPVDDQEQQDFQTGQIFTDDTNGDGITKPFDDGSCIPGADEGTARFRTVTGRVGLKYKFESGWMAYGSIARGEKPGGLQLVRSDVVLPGGIASELIVQPFDPEKITAYELGIKGYTADRRVGLDLAVFYNDWSDIVLRQITETSPITGRQFTQATALNFNAGDAAVWGWEATAELGITEDLKGRLTVGYTDSQLKNARMDTFAVFPSFYTTEPSCAPAAIQAMPDPTPERPVNTGPDGNPDPGNGGYLNNEGNEAQITKAAQCRQLSGDVSGNTQMRQPEWTASASLSYSHQLAGDWEWFTRADANYTGKIYVGNDNQGWLPARTNVNLRLGAGTHRYSVELWVRNLLNDNTPIAAFRDIYWANSDDLQGVENPTSIQDASNFEDFPPLRLSVTYPSLRTFGLIGKVRFGGADE
ncbi:MAG: TonB-dependent receptor [Gammaproteobacteria bacterium]